MDSAAARTAETRSTGSDPVICRDWLFVSSFQLSGARTSPAAFVRSHFAHAQKSQECKWLGGFCYSQGIRVGAISRRQGAQMSKSLPPRCIVSALKVDGFASWDKRVICRLILHYPEFKDLAASDLPLV
jgi:hypothetical protein